MATSTDHGNRQIGSIRGLACVLLVAYHVIGPTINDGLKLSDDSMLRYTVTTLDFVRMPLFSAISGYLYATRRVTRASLAAFARNKARRLLVPLVFVTLVIWAVRLEVYGSEIDLTHAIFFHYQHLWFLQSLILIFAIVAAIDILIAPNWHILCLFAFFGMTAGRSWIITDFFSTNGMVYLLPYFIFGMVCYLEPRIIFCPESRIIGLGIFAIVMADHLLGMAGLAQPLQRQLFPSIFCGMAALVILMQRMPRVPFLAAIGSFSYTIYLWHPVASAGTRALLDHYAMNLVPLRFLVSLAAGIGAPIVLHRLAAPIPYLSVLLTGNRRKTKRDGSSHAVGGDTTPVGHRMTAALAQWRRPARPDRPNELSPDPVLGGA